MLYIKPIAPLYRPNNLDEERALERKIEDEENAKRIVIKKSVFPWILFAIGVVAYLLIGKK